MGLQFIQLRVGAAKIGTPPIYSSKYTSLVITILVHS